MLNIFGNSILATEEGLGFWSRVSDWFGTNYIDLIIAGGIIIAAFIANIIFKNWLKNRILKITEKTATKYDDVVLRSVLKPVSFVIFVIAIYFAIKIGTQSIHFNNPDHSINQIIDTALKTIFSLVIGWILWCLIDVLEVFLVNFTSKTKSTLDDQLVPMARKGAKILVFCIVGVMILDNAGVSVTGIVAGLGVGALAFALAGQEIVANLFGSVIIFVDRPFNIGDVVTVDGQTGTVTEVGFRSTRIITFEKTEIIIPNKDIAHKRIENVSKRPMRRSRFTFQFTVDSKPENLNSLISDLETYINSTENIDENPYVKLLGLKELGIELLVQYWIIDLDFDLSLKINHDVTMKILELSQRYNCPLASREVAVHPEGSQFRTNSDLHSLPTQTLKMREKQNAIKFDASEEEYKPTEAQQKFLEIAIENKGKELNTEKLVDLAGITMKTYQKWTKNEEFLRWLDANT